MDDVLPDVPPLTGPSAFMESHQAFPDCLLFSLTVVYLIKSMGRDRRAQRESLSDAICTPSIFISPYIFYTPYASKKVLAIFNMTI